jgi:deoxyribonuclease V
VFPRRGKVDPETLAAWKAEQQRLRTAVRIEPLGGLPQIVAGADCAFDGDDIVAVAVAWDRRERAVVEEQSVRMPVAVPYIPGYLGFREAPAVLAALRALNTKYGAVLIDGQGVAHPRRCGLAVHVGVALDSPTVGVAKSRLIGDHDEPGDAGGSVPLTHDGGEIGRVLRTRQGVKPLWLSVGHRVDLSGCVALTLACQTRYRLPGPTREADRRVAAAKKRPD